MDSETRSKLANHPLAHILAQAIWRIMEAADHKALDLALPTNDLKALAKALRLTKIQLAQIAGRSHNVGSLLREQFPAIDFAQLLSSDLDRRE